MKRPERDRTIKTRYIMEFIRTVTGCLLVILIAVMVMLDLFSGILCN